MEAARDLAALPLNRADVSLQLLYLLVKYSTLMALTAAKLPFAAPAEATLGLVMICGYAASGALMVSVWTITPGEPAKLNNTDLGIALLIGFAPAALLGIPGLTGLAAAIVVSFAFTIYVKITGAVRTAQRLELTQQLTETAFYLGALSPPAELRLLLIRGRGARRRQPCPAAAAAPARPGSGA